MTYPRTTKAAAWACVITLVAWTFWADRWSNGAKDCLELGGNKFDSWGWSCHFHAVLKRVDR